MLLSFFFSFSYRTPIIEKWFHAAGVWDRKKDMAYLYLDGQQVGSEGVPDDLYSTDHNYSFFDIGLKRDANHTMKGYLRDLMIIKAALTGDEILNITGTSSFYNYDVSPRLTTNPLGTTNTLGTTNPSGGKSYKRYRNDRNDI